MNPIIDVGLYRFCIENCPEILLPTLHDLYDESLLQNTDKPIDFFLNIKSTSFIRKLLGKPQVCIFADNERPFHPLNPKLLMPSIEWGMNWCITSFNFDHLLIHSSVLVKNGKAIVFPAIPGSGKSTLATFFGLNGWDVYSDEMAIIDLAANNVFPMHRPSSLKNASIEVIRRSCDGVVMSPVTHGTHKGDIAHAKLTDRSHFNTLKPAKIVAIVSPTYVANGHFNIEEVSQIEGFARLNHHSFNGSILGEAGFEALRNVIEDSRCFTLTYPSYDGVEAFLQELVE